MKIFKKISTYFLGVSLCIGLSSTSFAELQVNTTPIGVPKAQISWSDDDAKNLLSNDADEEDAPEGGTVVSITQRPGTTTKPPPVSDTRFFNNAGPIVKAGSALVMDAQTGEVLFSKNSSTARPMASITKLMTAVVIADAHLNMSEQITLDQVDFVGPKQASTKLRIGDQMNRAEVLLMALMKSENPAAAALARTYPGGKVAFISAMNLKAQQLGMHSTRYFESTGLDARNVSSARDLAILVAEAYKYGAIRQFSSTAHYDFDLGYRMLNASNTNALVRNGGWNINLSKTGFINEAGRCVVMHTTVNSRPAVVVLMGEPTTEARNADATDLLNWLSALPKDA
ncbi:serine hydrolase [Acinetobacter boissieri]|uniref:D-alanyl-D-alanine endopeptidase (Penicillin-binding protein 7) n=1 Tax=Acinetobacter boissieri TaxID=1219383 RepID=A0A1G6HNT5_9GAMM|nr:serine hydrolase [Acinetobacter boissieri]SDB95545.1 D-alanyl-D-alanine endopeptidase (penicillin-binding protein 7) [Acinetobacter boissieri]